MKRRDFIRNVAPVAFMGGFKINAWSHFPFLKGLEDAVDNDHVLILVQLTGGNDGLNTLIPLETYADYQAARANIAIPEADILKLGGYAKAGLHPAMTGMQSLYDNDRLAILQAVGYPSPDSSHFRSTDIWLAGDDSGQYLDTGWTGRFLGQTYTNFPVGYPNPTMPDPLAIQIGSVISPVFMSAGGTTAMAVPTDVDFYDLINGITQPEPDTPMGNELTYLRAVARQTNKYATAIETAAKKINSQYGGYPDNDLAAQLKTVARLIAGGLKTRVYLVSTGGFDTHGGQVQSGDTTTGRHSELLAGVSDAITAFMTDCTQLGINKQVMGMTFSEFSRRIVSNGSFGTDHGAAQPVFIFGDYAATGVLGNNPDLKATNVESNIQMQYDFRSVYSTLLRDWFCVSSSDVSTILLKNYQYLPFMKNTACNNNYNNLNNIGDNLIRNDPNPFGNSTTITFTTAGGHTLIQVFDAAGRLVMVPVDQDYAQGTYRVTVDTALIAAGVYYARFQNLSVQQVRTMLKARHD
jgi:uncharacterized protein (DUF1501 family)